MKRTGRGRIAATFAVAMLAGAVVLLSGCAAPEEPGARQPVSEQPKLASDVSLDQVLAETSAALAVATETTSSFDPFLVSLEALRPKPPAEPEKKGGPVAVEIVYPPNLSLVDRAVTVRASVQGEEPVDSVEFYLDGEKVFTASQAPFEWSFDPSAYGRSRHTVRVVARSGDYRASDSITLYGIVKGSVIIFPWRPQGGNLPYQYFRNYYTPDGEKVEAALFTAFGPSYYIDYRFTLPAGMAYLVGSLSADGKAVAWGTSAGGSTETVTEPPIEFYFWDWSVGGFPTQNFYAIGGAQFDNPYEVYTFENATQVAGSEVPGIPFYGFDPATKQVRLRVRGTGPVKFFLKPMELTYYAYYDTDTPTVRIRRALRASGYSFIEFTATEPVFYTVYAYDASRRLVATKRGAKPQGWVDVRVERGDVAYFKVSVRDAANHSRTTGFIPTR